MTLDAGIICTTSDEATVVIECTVSVVLAADGVGGNGL